MNILSVNQIHVLHFFIILSNLFNQLNWEKQRFTITLCPYLHNQHLLMKLNTIKLATPLQKISNNHVTLLLLLDFQLTYLGYFNLSVFIVVNINMRLVIKLIDEILCLLYSDSKEMIELCVHIYNALLTRLIIYYQRQPLKMKEQEEMQDSANYIMYEKIRIQNRVHKHTLNEADSYKESLARQYFQLANAYYKKKEYQNSINFYQSALKYSFQSHEIHNNLGVMLALLKNMDEAIKSFNKSIQLKITQVFAHINLANIYIKMGCFTKGFELYLNLLNSNQKEPNRDSHHERRILDHLNKVINNYNTFYKFFRKNLKARHRKMNSKILENNLKFLLKDINKNSPIADFIGSPQNIINQSHLCELKAKFDEIFTVYSNLPWSHNRSKLSLTKSYANQFSKCFSSIINKEIIDVLGLIFAYIFIEKEEFQLSYHFYSKINKLQSMSIRETYLTFYRNYQLFKKSNYSAVDFKQIQTGEGQQKDSKQSMILSIDRFFYHENLPMYYLQDFLSQNFTLKQYNWQSIEPFAKSLKRLPKYQASAAFFFNQYVRDKKKPQIIEDYLFEASLNQFNQYQVERACNFQNMLNMIERQLDQGYCTISQQMELISYQSFITFVVKKNPDQALSICEQAITHFKNQNHKFYQYIGSIYMAKGPRFWNKAEQFLRKAIQQSEEKQEAHFQLFCLLSLNFFYRQVDLKYRTKQIQIKIHLSEDTSKQENKQLKYQKYPQLSPQNKRQALSHLLQAIKIKPSQIKYYMQLSFAYQQQQYLRQDILAFINLLIEEYTKPIDFKIQSNIAIFYLMTYNYNYSYDYYCICLKEGAKNNDTDNFSDVKMVYFISKIAQISLIFTQEEHHFASEIFLYIIIFIKSSFIYVKYNHFQISEQALKILHTQMSIMIQKDFHVIINQVQKFDQEHKDIVYPYIFKTVLATSLNRLSLYNKLCQMQPSVQRCFWSYELVSQIRENTIQNIKLFLQSLKKGIYLQEMEIKSNKTYVQTLQKLILHYLLQPVASNSTNIFSPLKHYLQQIYCGEKISKQFLALQNKIKSLVRLRMVQIEKEKVITFKIDRKKFIDQIRKSLVQIQAIMVFYKQFYSEFKKNNTLQEEFINISLAFLQHKDIDSFFGKLTGYINGDYISENSSISLNDSKSSLPQNTMQKISNEPYFEEILKSSLGISEKVKKCMKQLIVQAEQYNFRSLINAGQQILEQQCTESYRSILFSLKLLLANKIKLQTFVKKISLLSSNKENIESSKFYKRPNDGKNFLKQSSNSPMLQIMDNN